MMCDRCETPLTEAQVRRGARFCSDRCRKAAYRQRERERRAEDFRREYEDHYGPMSEGPSDLEEVHRLLMTAARLGSVTAAKTLLEELRRDAYPAVPGIIDELTAKRRGIPRRPRDA